MTDSKTGNVNLYNLTVESMAKRDPRISKLLGATDSDKDEWYFFIQQKVKMLQEKQNVPMKVYEALYDLVSCCSFTKERIPFQLVHSVRNEVSSVITDLLNYDFSSGSSG